jgi:hypothetical protein
MTKEGFHEFPSIWGPCRIELFTAIGIREYRTRDEKIHRPPMGESFCSIKARGKIIRTNQYLSVNTFLEKVDVIYVDRNDRHYRPLATNADSEGWAYYLYSLPTNLFPPKSMLFALPQANA